MEKVVWIEESAELTEEKVRAFQGGHITILAPIDPPVKNDDTGHNWKWEIRKDGQSTSGQ